MSMKNSNDTIGNRNRDLPVCSAVPQPTEKMGVGGNNNTVVTTMTLTTVLLETLTAARIHKNASYFTEPAVPLLCLQVSDTALFYITKYKRKFDAMKAYTGSRFIVLLILNLGMK
jgi:hypothetical protein